MSETPPGVPETKERAPNEFEQAGAAAAPSLVSEFIYFVRENKKWWLIPVLLVIALIGVLAALGSTGLAPAIYTVF